MLLRQSKRILTNLLFSFPVSYLNEFTNETTIFDCCVYQEKADVYPEIDFYIELYQSSNFVAKLKIVLSVAEKRITYKRISLEYFSQQLTKIFESFVGKQILKRYIDGLCNAEERHRSINI